MSDNDVVKVVEVGPRDGLQNEAKRVPVEVRIALVDALTAAGLPVIEVGAFVSPKWVPQMADSDVVLRSIERQPGRQYPVLVPNLQGYEAARSAGAQEISIFAAASEAFSQRNINCSIAESLDRFRPVATAARIAGLTLRGYISCVLGCPYQGAVPVADVVRVARDLVAMGCGEISLGDTIGVGTASQAREVVAAVAREIGLAKVAVHFHDTYGQALANVIACLDLGVRVVDASVAGLGGCPYAKGATGNLATEDLVYMLNGLGLKTGIDLDDLIAAGEGICSYLGKPPASRAARAIIAKRHM
ncbi:MAG TPA: hydroxymethylglutaryl-CoA lyase [Terriglobales bacterium]|nr:hydroxymethylglutaryl-CoA lyase [Terriglobales bacterium]